MARSAPRVLEFRSKGPLPARRGGEHSTRTRRRAPEPRLPNNTCTGDESDDQNLDDRDRDPPERGHAAGGARRLRAGPPAGIRDS